MKIPKKFSEILFLVEISNGSRNARSGFLDADSLLIQAEMFMQPDAFKRFKHFYDKQVSFKFFCSKLSKTRQSHKKDIFGTFTTIFHENTLKMYIFFSKFGWFQSF